MPKRLSKEDINNLMKGLEDTKEDATSESEDTGISGKVLRFRPNKNRRNIFPYHSPIVAKGTYILNPETGTEIPEGIQVVRTIENYQQFIKQQRIQEMT